MATNRTSGDNRRHGAVKHRSQFLNPRTGHYTKRDGDTGKFMDNKSDLEKFKGIREEK